MDTAIAVCAYNRPHLFKRVITCLERSVGIKELPVWFFIDVGHPACNDVKDMAKKAKIPNKQIIVRPHNYGCGRNLICARRRCFDREKFDRLLVFEDDMVFSPEYIQLVRNIMDWAKPRFNNVGTVQAHSLAPLMSRKDAEAKRLIVGKAHVHFWGYGMEREAWNTIRDRVHDFDEKFLRHLKRYGDRNHRAIREYFKPGLLNAKRPDGNAIHRLVPPMSISGTARWATGQDACTAVALYEKGLGRLTTVVPRTHYIGESGTHSNPEWYRKKRFNESAKFSFPEDTTTTEFTFGAKPVMG